jgi:hypothetical protein
MWAHLLLIFVSLVLKDDSVVMDTYKQRYQISKIITFNNTESIRKDNECLNNS